MNRHRAVIIESFVDEGLGNSSYLVAAEGGKAAVAIDPQRDVDRYLEVATRRGWTITHTLETHLHADFVSGSRELAARTGAVILASEAAQLAFPHQPLRDGEIFEAAGLRFEGLATPGHTPEHLSFLVLSESAGPQALFSGGALLPGSAARTDLIGPEWTLPLTRALYHSMHDRLMVLPDDLRVLPTHGAGSFCAVGDPTQRTTTIGRERETNPLLAAAAEEEFVAMALRDLPPYPDYFLRMRALNRQGPRLLGDLPAPPALSPEAVHRALGAGALLIDTRPSEAFDAGHVLGAFGIALGPSFASWVGWIIPADAPLVLLVESAAALREAVHHLIRVGYEDFQGFLDGGMEAWRRTYPAVVIDRVAVDEVSAAGRADRILDVREASEWRRGHIPTALSRPLSELRHHIDGLPRDRRLLVHCAHEFRSTIATSLLERAGLRVARLAGGFEAWHTAGRPIDVPAS